MADKLRQVLEKQGRKTKWLAERTGYSYQYVVSVLNGTFPMREEFRQKCADALDLPVDVLFDVPMEDGSDGTDVSTLDD